MPDDYITHVYASETQSAHSQFSGELILTAIQHFTVWCLLRSL